MQFVYNDTKNPVIVSTFVNGKPGFSINFEDGSWSNKYEWEG